MSKITKSNSDLNKDIGIDDNATSTAITIDASENVGIGTPSPSLALDVNGRAIIAQSAVGNYEMLTLNQGFAGSASRLRFINSSGGNCDIEAVAGVANTMAFRTNGTERMRIDSAGTVGIGTPGPGANTKLTIATTTSLIWPLKLAGKDYGGVINLSDTSGYALYFTAGNVYTGAVTLSGSTTTYATGSDYRLKENVVPMTGSIDRLKALKPSRFNFIADADKTVDGFLAHEAQSVVPECATGTKDGMKDEEYEVTPALGEVFIPSFEGVTDNNGNTPVNPEQVISSGVEKPDLLNDDEQWREVTPVVMGTRSVPDYQGIDQSKLVPLLVASLQEAIARIEVLENA